MQTTAVERSPIGARSARWPACSAIVFRLLRSPLGAAIQAIRDNEEAAESIGVRVMSAKRLVFTLAAFGAALAGALWVATALTFQPKAYFSPLWTAYMIFMALVGGLGTFEGAILGAVIFFAIETWFGDMGVWYLVGLGATALIFALLFPRGIWGWIEDRTSLRLLPVGYRLRFASPDGRAAQATGARKPRVREGLTCFWERRSSSPEFRPALARASVNSPQALGADIIGVDINEPTRPLDAFIKADIGSAQGVAEIVQTLPQRFDALCNVAGVSGTIGAARTLAINFYGLRELTKASRRGCARAAPWSTSPRSPATAGAPISSAPRRSWPRRVSRSRQASRSPSGSGRRGLSAVEGAPAPMDDAGGASAAVQGPRSAGERGEPRPGDDADPQGIPADLRRSAR